MGHTSIIIYILVYVDDILIMGSDIDTLVEQLIHDLSSTFSLKDLGLVDYFLGILVTKTLASILLTQTKYLRDLLTKADMQNVNTQNTSMNSGLKLSNYKNWASDPDDKRSTLGHCIYLGRNLVAWKSQKQDTISSYLGPVFAYELHIPQAVIPSMWCDNQSTVLLAANPVIHARTKHIEIDLYIVRDKVLQQHIHV
ncbi:uncharacterized mitochondrial protein AtMg00810-like [Cannabis sativa]|uniref:uncharacterized mitochondrial protein AtMg00810-like n=1 Tax=Cannabis sativa TaxID=3483 RepID=UPI0029C9D4A8|nr:uncharacterized mitochondrial protein AtMg00810-like [Cannabis sativa]